jgi:hypothetical protein
VSNPFDVLCATQSLESFPSRQLYNRHIAQRLKMLLTANKGVFEKASPPLLDWAAVEAAQTIRQFDERVIVPMFGYPDLAAYYNGRAFWWRRVPLADICWATNRRINDNTYSSCGRAAVVSQCRGRPVCASQGHLS